MAVAPLAFGALGANLVTDSLHGCDVQQRNGAAIHDQLCATDEVGIEHGEATCDSRYGRQQTDYASSRVGGADDRQCADQRECGAQTEGGEKQNVHEGVERLNVFAWERGLVSIRLRNISVTGGAATWPAHLRYKGRSRKA